MRNKRAGRPERFPEKKVIGFEQEMLDAIDAWRAANKPILNVSEAIRRLIELGLASAASAPAGVGGATKVSARADAAGDGAQGRSKKQNMKTGE